MAEYFLRSLLKGPTLIEPVFFFVGNMKKTGDPKGIFSFMSEIPRCGSPVC